MAKNVLILSGSPRKGGNSDVLCDEFMRGAKESGNNVEKVFIRDEEISYCNACYYCSKNDGKCAIKDGMNALLEKMLAADVLVMASPVYFYSIDAQLKAVIDRTVAKWTRFENKEFYYIMTAAEDSDTVMDCTLECFRGFAACTNDPKEMGVIYGKGLYEVGEVKDSPYMDQAYKMGLKV